MGIKDFFCGQNRRFSAQKNDCVSLEPPGFSLTFVVAFCVLISRLMRKSGSFAGKEHVE